MEGEYENDDSESDNGESKQNEDQQSNSAPRSTAQIADSRNPCRTKSIVLWVEKLATPHPCHAKPEPAQLNDREQEDPPGPAR